MGTVINSKEIYLHIGLHKTATTFLQHNIFPHLEGIEFYNRKLDLNKLYQAKKKLLISNEGMSGSPYIIDEINYFEQFKKSIDYLLDIFISPKIIICFREPSKLIESCYKQYLHEGGTLKWDEFFSLEGSSKIKPDGFYFSKFVEYICEKIPQQDLFIYDFESFKSHSDIVINCMSMFISGNNFPGTIKNNKRSNSGVPLLLENMLIKSNKLLGHKINFKIFGKRLNQRVVFQTLIPRIINFNKERDLSKIKKYYDNDFKVAKNMIKTSNYNLYKNIDKK